jgi:molecular chaperone DnaK (HSP70)
LPKARLLLKFPDRQIPSTLAYVEGHEFQGTQAKAQLVRNPNNTIAYFRDFLGKEFVLDSG